MLIQGVFEHWGHFKICADPDCASPYFIAKRKDQTVRDAEMCKSEKQRQHALKWWRDNRAKKDQKETGAKRQRNGARAVSLVKHGKTRYTHFVVNGQRFRQSLGTTDWREAQAKEKQLIAEAAVGKLTQNSTTLARQPFGQAADDYVSARKLELATASQAKEKQLFVQLRAYFKEEPLKAITVKRITDYLT